MKSIIFKTPDLVLTVDTSTVLPHARVGNQHILLLMKYQNPESKQVTKRGSFSSLVFSLVDYLPGPFGPKIDLSIFLCPGERQEAF